MRRFVFPNIATVDFLFSLLIVFITLLNLNLLVKVKKESGHRDRSQDAFQFRMSWPGQSLDDVDLYVEDPLGQICFFKAVRIDLMNLDQDDVGGHSDEVNMADGSTIKAEWHCETTSLRAIIPGQYIVNVHMFSKQDDKATPVTVKLVRIMDTSDEIIAAYTATLLEHGQEENMFVFILDGTGNVSNLHRDPGIKLIR